MSSLAELNAAAEALWARLSPQWPGLDLEVRPQAASTNTELLQRARAGLAGPSVLLALEQTAGRGRRGRAWAARPGASLTFSVGLPWPLAPSAAPAQAQPTPNAGPAAASTDASALSLAVGVAVAEALHPAVKLKWPNDLCLLRPGGGLAKLGGILIETVSQGAGLRAVVIGVGINIQAPTLNAGSPGQEEPGAAPALPWAALAELQPGASAAATWQQVLPALLQAAADFSAAGWAAFEPRFAARDALAGARVQVHRGAPGEGAPVESGQALGTDRHGRLLVHTAAGLRAVDSGEVSVRATPPGA